MNPYTILLFVHIAGLTSLFGGIAVMQRGGAKVRNAATWEEAHTWLGLLNGTRGAFIAGNVLLLITGIGMAQLQWTFETPWVAVATALVIVFAVVGGMVGKAVARLHEGAGRRSGPISDAERAIVTSPGLWSTIFALNGGAMGIIWLMTTKPGWAVSIAAPVALALLGAAIGRAVAARRPARREP